MKNDGKDENLVNLKDWKKQKAKDDQEKAKAQAKAKAASGASSSGVPSGIATKVIIALFVIGLLWLAMPANFFNILLTTITGGSAGH